MTGTYERIATILEDSYATLATRNDCPITTATFLEVLVDFFATLIMSNSMSLVLPTCYILTTAGEKAESFFVPLLVMQKEMVAKESALALQERPLRRGMTLVNYVHALKNRPLRNGNAKTLHYSSTADVDALRCVNIALQNMSDENDLAILRICSARELRWASDITQCLDTNVDVISKSHRQFDFALALRGYALGECFALNNSNTEFHAWIRLLSEAGAEYSVSPLPWYMDGLLTVGFRICVQGQQQSSLYELFSMLYWIMISTLAQTLEFSKCIWCSAIPLKMTMRI